MKRRRRRYQHTTEERASMIAALILGDNRAMSTGELAVYFAVHRNTIYCQMRRLCRVLPIVLVEGKWQRV